MQMEQNKDRSDYIKAKQAEHDLHEREVMHERRVQEAKMMKDQRQQKEIATKLREEENIKVYKNSRTQARKGIDMEEGGERSSPVSLIDE